MEKNNLVGTVCFYAISLESLVGLFTNVFIIIGISFRYLKHHDISGNDKIILALSISNVAYICVAFAYISIYQFWPSLFVTPYFVPAIFVSFMFIITSSSWLTASLCFYYYIKINNFSCNFLSRLKVKIGSLVPWMIFTSILLSLFSSSLNIFQFTANKEHSRNLSAVYSANTSWPSTTSGKIFQENLYIAYVSHLIPFLISVVTTASTIWSLNLHRLKMKRKKAPSSGSKDRVRTYKGIVQIMIYLLVFYAVFYLVLFLFYFNTFAVGGVFLWIFLLMICSFGPVQSILLTLATTKLKKAWMKIFHCSAGSGEGDENRKA
ncbi:taste receptor type 2 member 39-like [Mantella aurantiaca]